MNTLFYGTCVAVEDCGILIRGPSGSGKSDLALRLIDEGAQLVSDDQIQLTNQNGILLANAPHTIKGKLEIRGVGILDVPAAENVPVKLIVGLVLENNLDRLPDHTTEEILGIPVPHLVFYPFEISATAKLRAYVRQTGYPDERT